MQVPVLAGAKSASQNSRFCILSSLAATVQREFCERHLGYATPFLACTGTRHGCDGAAERSRKRFRRRPGRQDMTQ